jgi:hypothetical protein
LAADFEFVRTVRRGLPGTEEATSYGTAALKVRGKLFARLKEDGVTLVLRSSFEDRDFLLQAHPDVFSLTDHYRDYPYVLVRLSRVRRAQLRELLEIGWRAVAPKRLVMEFEEGVVG